MGSWKGRGNQYIQFVRVLYCKLLTNGKQLPAFPLEAVPETEPWPQRWEAKVLPYIAFNSQGHIAMGSLWSEEPENTSWSRFCTVNHQASLSNYQLSSMKGLG